MPCCVRGTSTNTELQVEAFMLEGDCNKGKSVTDEEMQQLNIQGAAVGGHKIGRLHPGPLSSAGPQSRPPDG